MKANYSVNLYYLTSFLLTIIFFVLLSYSAFPIKNLTKSIYLMSQLDDITKELKHYQILNKKYSDIKHQELDANSFIMSVSELTNKNNLEIITIEQINGSKESKSSYHIILKGSYNNLGYFMNKIENNGISKNLSKLKLFLNDKHELLSEMYFMEFN